MIKKLFLISALSASLLLTACSGDDEKDKKNEDIKTEKVTKNQEELIYEGDFFYKDDKNLILVSVNKEDKDIFEINERIINFDLDNLVLSDYEEDYLVFVEGNEITVKGNENKYKFKKESITLSYKNSNFNLSKDDLENINKDIESFKKNGEELIEITIIKLAKEYYYNQHPSPKDNVVFEPIKIDNNQYNVNLCVSNESECFTENLLIFNVNKRTFTPKFPFVDSKETENTNIKNKTEDVSKKALEKVKLYYDAEYGIYDGLKFKIESVTDISVEIKAYEINKENDQLVTVGTYIYNFIDDVVIE